MTIEILNRSRQVTGRGVWYTYTGAVNGQKIGVRLPACYVESVSEREADREVKESLKDEYHRRHMPEGGAVSA